MDKKRILILNGANMDAIGRRETAIYGTVSLADYLDRLKVKYPGVALHCQTSNDLSVLVDIIGKAEDYDGIIINPGAYTHTSIVLADAIRASSVPFVEVHLSNLFGREQYRKNSFISAHCRGFIAGFGMKGYELALCSFLD